MKKETMYKTLGVVGATIGAIAAQSYFKNNKNKDKDNNLYSYINNAGLPDQSSEIDNTQIENSKMVSEGSTFGVHYYNQNKNE